MMVLYTCSPGQSTGIGLEFVLRHPGGGGGGVDLTDRTFFVKYALKNKAVYAANP